jgi:hypothetical protein
MAKKTTKINTNNELTAPADMPELETQNQLPEISPPPLPKELVIGARGQAKETLGVSGAEFNGVGCA